MQTHAINHALHEFAWGHCRTSSPISVAVVNVNRTLKDLDWENQWLNKKLFKDSETIWQHCDVVWN